MRPEFARAVDPIFQTSLQFIHRLERGDKLVAGDQRALLQRKIDEAEAILGNSEEWNLAKYALCAWIDSQLIHAPWQGSKWWIDNCLENKYFGRRLAHEDFYRKAVEAGRLSRKDALEVYYLAVVLGFRGFYSDQDTSSLRSFAHSLKLPDSIEGWCREVAMILQLRQGRPPIPESVQAGGSAKPLNGRTMLIGVSMISVLLIALAIGCYLLWFAGRSDQSPQGNAGTAVNSTQYSVVGTRYSVLGTQRLVFQFLVSHVQQPCPPTAVISTSHSLPPRRMLSGRQFSFFDTCSL